MLLLVMVMGFCFGALKDVLVQASALSGYYENIDASLEVYEKAMDPYWRRTTDSNEKIVYDDDFVYSPFVGKAHSQRRKRR